MLRKRAASLAGLLILLPIGGRLHIALARGIEPVGGLRIMPQPLPSLEQVLALSCLIVLALVLARLRDGRRGSALRH